MGVVETWNTIWEGIDKNKLESWHDMAKLILPSIKKEIGEVSGKYIVEAGCGSGLVSLSLDKNGGKVFLLDISKKALQLTDKLKNELGASAILICGSVLSMPFKDNSFDIVWNSGVLEHFIAKQRDKIIQEMYRICKSQGKVIIAVPYAKAFFYRLGKYLAERYGRWEYGDEKPINSLKPEFKKYNPSQVKEQDICFEINAGYIMQLSLRFGLKLRIRNFLIKYKKLLKPIFRGYLLVTTATKQ